MSKATSAVTNLYNNRTPTQVADNLYNNRTPTQGDEGEESGSDESGSEESGSDESGSEDIEEAGCGVGRGDAQSRETSPLTGGKGGAKQLHATSGKGRAKKKK